MLVQALAEYTDTYLSEQLSDQAWEEKPVPWFIAIDEAGKFLNVIAHNVAVPRGKKVVSVPAPLAVPRSPVPRNAGLYPLLAADDIKYVLGVGPWTPPNQEDNNRERHEAFVKLIGQAAAETNDSGLNAASMFYGRDDQVEAARIALAEAKPGSLIALALGIEPIVNRKAVRDCWTKLYNAAASDRLEGGAEGECLISGRIGPLAPTHEKIKGLFSLGGLAAGVSLMSFDKDAFRSYGWEKNANSPVAPDRAMAYVLALNDLLRGSEHRRDIAGVGFIFWTKEKTDYDPMLTVYQADADQVKRLLSLTGPKADLDENKFYMAGVAGNGGRLIVRYWIAEKLGTVKNNVNGWFEDLKMVDRTGEIPHDQPSLLRLQQAIGRKRKDGERTASPAQVIALIRRAIEGTSCPLGYQMLCAALARLRNSAYNRRNPVLLGLLRISLNDISLARGLGEQIMTTNLDAGQAHPAYLCGRLLAVYESLQRKSHETKVNHSVTDRFYTMASTQPERAFPQLEELGQKHLKRLRRGKPGASSRIADEISDIHVQLGRANEHRFPRRFEPEDQGRFALGYHHQRSEQQARAKAAHAEKKARALKRQENL
jgi:CRISPR-associated protein Csd1